MTDPELLALAADLAGKAAQAILAVRARGFDVDTKSDASPVTEADRAAEELILAGLRAATPEIQVVAEEEIAAGHVRTVTAEYWLVDPLDGTREFAKGYDEFTVNVGLVRGGRAVLGAVAVPATGEMFTGILGQGAWKSEHGGPPRPIAAREVPEEGATLLGSRHHSVDSRLDAFVEGKRIARIIPMGSALKFLRLAEGAADIYPRFGRTMEWDTAAPQAVLEAAGGKVTLFDGTPLAYGKPDWANPSFLCTGK
jgi:3'(2'), 5'-bisphosphate nucleotidase